MSGRLDEHRTSNTQRPTSIVLIVPINSGVLAPWRFLMTAPPVPVFSYTTLVRQFAAAPPGKLYCFHGGRGVFRFSLHAASHALLRGIPIALIDGTNRFDLYAITAFARQLGNRRATPEELLERMFISRAFTCYQMEAVITDRLPAFVARERIPVVIIFGLLDTFYDEQAPFFEVKAGLRRIMASLQRLKRDNIAVLLTLQDTTPASAERRSLFPSVAAGADRVFTLMRPWETKENEPQSHRATEKKERWFGA
jgi:hypothetical protein